MTLAFQPSHEQQMPLPLGETFEMALSGVVKDRHAQVCTACAKRLVTMLLQVS